MKKSIILLSTIALLLTAFNSTAGSKEGEEGKALSTDEIKTLFSGKTSDWKKKKNGWIFKIYTAENGEQIVSYITGKKAGEKRIIRWSAEDNMHCGHRDGKKFCGKIISVGNGEYHKVRDGKVRNVLTNFVEGNQL